jgi:hypothetical protein
MGVAKLTESLKTAQTKYQRLKADEESTPGCIPNWKDLPGESICSSSEVVANHLLSVNDSAFRRAASTLTHYNSELKEPAGRNVKPETWVALQALEVICDLSVRLVNARLLERE